MGFVFVLGIDRVRQGDWILAKGCVRAEAALLREESTRSRSNPRSFEPDVSADAWMGQTIPDSLSRSNDTMGARPAMHGFACPCARDESHAGGEHCRKMHGTGSGISRVFTVR